MLLQRLNSRRGADKRSAGHFPHWLTPLVAAAARLYPESHRVSGRQTGRDRTIGTTPGLGDLNLLPGRALFRAPAQGDRRGRGHVSRLTGGAPPAGFAYPHGDWDVSSREQVIAAGYSWAVTVGFARVDPRSFDRFALPRFPAGDRAGSELEHAIRAADR